MGMANGKASIPKIWSGATFGLSKKLSNTLLYISMGSVLHIVYYLLRIDRNRSAMGFKIVWESLVYILHIFFFLIHEVHLI